MKYRLLAGALALALLLSACGSEPTPVPTPAPTPTPAPVAREFVLPCYAAASLHPITGESKTNFALSSLVYEGLFRLNNVFEPEAVLCQAYSCSENGLTWIFTPADRRFSDGSPVTAAEVASSLLLAKESSLYASRLTDVRSIRAVDGQVILTLSRPRGGLPALLDIPIVKEQGEGLPPLGTGRYLYSKEENDTVLLRTGVGADALPERISLADMWGADDLISAFDTHEISLVTADLTGTDSLGYSGDYEAWDYPTTHMVYLGFRTDQGFCRDAVLRSAISRTLDRETIVTALYSRHAVAAALPCHPESSGYHHQTAQSLSYDLSLAQQILTEGGYTLSDEGLHKGRSRVRLTLLVNTDNATRLSVANYLAQEMEKLGLAVTVKGLPWADYLTALKTGSFDLYLGETLLPGDFDLTPLLEPKGTLNYGRWSDRETTALLAALRQTQQEGAPFALHFAQILPFAPICFKNHSVLTQWGQVTGLTPTRGDPFAGEDWRFSSLSQP